MTNSLKPLHPWISKFMCSMISLQGLRLEKFYLVENSRWPPILKTAKSIKSAFSPELLGIFGWNFVWSISRTLMLNDIEMKKKSVAEKSHSDCSKISSTLTKFSSTLAFKFISPEWLGIFGWNMYGVVLCGIKMKKKNEAELCHSDCLKIYVDPSKSFVDPGILVHSLKPLHPCFSNFTCSMMRLQGFRMMKSSLVRLSRIKNGRCC